MRPILTCFLILAAVSICFCQEIDLHGRVSIHNSRYRTSEIEYVANAFIRAPFAGSTNSDSEGEFLLVFTGIQTGTTIRLTVEKEGLEVVNSHDLDRVILGRIEALPIYMAPVGQLANAQTELYNISRAALFASRDARISRLLGEREESERALQELEEDLGIEIADVQSAILLLEEKIEQIERRLPEIAQELAKVNLDFASGLYLEAFLLFQEGRIEQAIDAIDLAELKSSFDNAVETIREAERLDSIRHNLLRGAYLQIQQIVASHRLKAEAHSLLFQYQNAAAVQEDLIKILVEAYGNSTYELALSLKQLGTYYRNAGDFPNALAAIEKGVLISEELFEENHPEIARSLNILALTYLDLGEYYNALDAQQKAISILEQGGDPNMAEIGTFYNNLAQIHLALGNLDVAIDAQHLSISLFEQAFGSEHKSLATLYNNLAGIYEKKGDYEEALAPQEKAITIQLENLSPNHPKIASSFNNLSLILRGLENFEAAFAAQEKAIEIREDVLAPDHPHLATSYHNLSSILQGLGDFQAALIEERKALAIRLESLGLEHPDVANSFHGIGAIYFRLENLDSALHYQSQAFEMLDAKLPYNHPNLMITRNHLSLFYVERGYRYRNQRLFKLARNDFEKGLEFGADEAKVSLLIAESYFNEEDYMNTIRYIEQSSGATNTDTAAALILSGISYTKLGELSNARDRFEELELLTPDMEVIHWCWAQYYSLSAESELALDHLEQAIDLGYDNWEWIRKDDTMDSLRHLPGFRALLEQAPSGNN